MRRLTKVKGLLAVGALATTMLVAAPSPALAACTGHTQPGGTLTVAGRQVRIPTIDVGYCWDGPTSSLVPDAEVITGPSGSCTTNCFALVIRQNPCCPATQITVWAELDGTGVRQQVVDVAHDDLNFCIVGVGFPAPPVSGCFVSFDPDF